MQRLQDSGISRALEDYIMGGDWNLCADVDDAACLRWAAMVEFCMQLQVREAPGPNDPTHWRRHPAMQAELNRCFDFWLLRSDARRCKPPHQSLSDHNAIAIIHDGRGARPWRARSDDPCWIAFRRGWQPRAVSERARARPARTRAPAVAERSKCGGGPRLDGPRRP